MMLLWLGLTPLTGCVGLWRGTARTFDLAPNGLTRTDDAFRRALTTGGYSDAFARAATVKRGAPPDALLRSLYRGLTGYYAGEYAASARAFGEGDRLAERRITKSVSRGAVAVLTNDLALPYLPSRTERLFLRYYAMLAYARAGDASAAAVEARRLGRLMQEEADDLRPEERALHAVLRDAAGAVFESVGEKNDALVSYRNAALLRGASRQCLDSIRLATPAGDSATLVVLVESGFVAHRVDRGFTVGVDDDVSRSGNEDDGSSPQNPATPSARMAHRIDEWMRALPGEGLFDAGVRDDAPWQWDRLLRSGSAQATQWLRLSWPALRRTSLPTAQLAVAIDSIDHLVSADAADVSLAVAADLRRARPAMLARMVARAAAKTALVGTLDDDTRWVGALVGLVGSGIERADTRSWQLLPGTLRAIRLTVPAGTHAPVLRVGNGLDQVLVRLPAVTVGGQNRLQVVDARIWRDASAMVARVP